MRTLMLFFVVALSGCGTPIDGADGDANAFLPHGEDFSRMHAVAALEDPAACLDCHPERLAEGQLPTETRLVACAVCHPFPVPDGWTAPYGWGQDTGGDR